MIPALAVLFVIVAVRLLLPWILLSVINKQIKKAKGITGRVNRVKVNLSAARLTILDLRISSNTKETDTSAFEVNCGKIEIDTKWKGLLRKEFNAHITVINPHVVVKSLVDNSTSNTPKENNDVASTGTLLGTEIRKIRILFDVDVLIQNASVSYARNTDDSEPISADHLNITLSHFSNKLSQSSIPARFELDCNVFEGKFSYDMTLLPLAEYFTCHLYARLHHANVTLMNHLLKEHANFDFSKGHLGITAEVVAVNGVFKGYIKPALSEFKIAGRDDKSDSTMNKIWEHTLASVARFLLNKNDQLVIRVPLQGRFDDPALDIMSTIKVGARKAVLQTAVRSAKNFFSLRSIIPQLF